MSTSRLGLAVASLALPLLLTACPQGGAAKVDPAAAQQALAPRDAKLPGAWCAPELKPAAGLQQVKLTPQLLAALAANAGAAPAVSADGYAIDDQPYKEGGPDDGLAGLAAGAMATDAPDATDRARPKRHGKYSLVACIGAVKWDSLLADTEKAMQSAGYRRIESADGPEGEAARFLSGDETNLAVLVHRVPRDTHQEFGVTEEFVYMACSLEKDSNP